jgi:NRPS condensation-like uncharacterized protein
MRENENYIQANGHDICNYIAKYGMANFQIQAVMKLDGRLDFDRLSRAVRLSVDLQPVLGCRFFKKDPPYWRRLGNIDLVEFCSMEKTNDLDQTADKFLNSPLDMDNDPMVKVKLIRCDTHDTLCIKLNHACTDGAGVKEYLKLLSDIYSQIDHSGDYIPESSIRNKKDHYRLFDSLGIKHPSSPWYPPLKASIPMWKFPWKNKYENDTYTTVCRLPLDQISRYAKSKEATVNDLVLTAFFRAMFKTSEPLYGIPMEIAVTVDLRRFLPEKKADAIRNFSGGVNPQISRKTHEPFEGTLFRVMRKMNKIKKENPGVLNALAAERVEQLNFRQMCGFCKALSRISVIASLGPFNSINTCAPTLSNLGIISQSLLKFGNIIVTDAYVVGPAIRSPGFLLLVSSYNGTLTLSASYYKGSISRKYIEKLLNKVKDELQKGCMQ